MQIYPQEPQDLRNTWVFYIALFYKLVSLSFYIYHSVSGPLYHIFVMVLYNFYNYFIHFTRFLLKLFKW